MQRRLNSNMQEVVKKEVLKLPDVGVIYSISNSEWVNPTQVVPKKGSITVMPTNERELVSTRALLGWSVYIDYRKINSVTRKDHFLLPSWIKCWKEW